jgi:hypothetical protein
MITVYNYDLTMMSSSARERCMNDASLFASAPTCAPLSTTVVLLQLHGLRYLFVQTGKGVQQM